MGMSASHKSADCNQKFDSEEAEGMHTKDSNEHSTKQSETFGRVTSAISLCEEEKMTSPSSQNGLQLQDASHADMECTICMEAIGEGTLLPCQCKLDYCRTCWDTALASSFSQCGQARCPSCRSWVRVDYDLEKECLIFTPETVDMTFSSQREAFQRLRQEYEDQLSGPGSEELFRSFVESHEDFPKLMELDRMRQGTIERLRKQAMPAQRKILQNFCEANLLDIRRNASQTLDKSSVSELKGLMKAVSVEAQGCLEKSDLVGRLVEKADATDLCNAWASQKCPVPKCVCGSSLERVRGVERFRHMLGDQATSLSDAHLQQVLRQGEQHVICDLCENRVPLATSSVWTCENRNSTILHATSYDVCDICFASAACKEDPAA